MIQRLLLLSLAASVCTLLPGCGERAHPVQPNQEPAHSTSGTPEPPSLASQSTQPTPAPASAVPIDTTFGTKGSTDLPVKARSTDGEYCTAIVTTITFGIDGAHYILGTFPLEGGGCDAGVAKLSARGEVDTTFGDRGLARVADRAGTPSAMSVLADGSLVVALGYVAKNAQLEPDHTSDLDGGKPSMAVEIAKKYALAIVKLKPDGKLDPSWGNGGIVRTQPRPGIAIEHIDGAGGTITLAGTHSVPINDFDLLVHDKAKAIAVRFTAAGVLDKTFGKGGIAEFAASRGPLLAFAGVTKTGALVYGGQKRGAAAFAVRLKPDLGVDETFGDKGYVDLGTKIDMTTAGIFVAPTGELSVSYAEDRVTFHRFTSAGAVDTGYGTAGSASADCGGFYQHAIGPDNGDVCLGGAVFSHVGPKGTIVSGRNGVELQGVASESRFGLDPRGGLLVVSNPVDKALRLTRFQL